MMKGRRASERASLLSSRRSLAYRRRRAVTKRIKSEVLPAMSLIPAEHSEADDFEMSGYIRRNEDDKSSGEFLRLAGCHKSETAFDSHTAESRVTRAHTAI